MLSITPSTEYENDVIILCHKQTQTSSISLRDSYTATSLANKETNVKGSIKLLEFNEVKEDPLKLSGIPIKIADETDEINDHKSSPSGSVKDETSENRYRYCREVIKPYLKDYPADCPISDEELIKDVLDSTQEDYPDYEPCFVDYDGNEDITENKDSALGSLKDIVLSDDSESSSCKKGKHLNPNISSNNLSRCNTSITLMSNMDQKDKCPPKIKPKGCPTKGKPGCPDPIETCKDEALWAPPGPPSCQAQSSGGTSRCKDRVPSAGSCKETPLAPPENEKSCDRNDMDKIKHNFGIESNSSVSALKEKTMMPAHSETIANIKMAVEDFFGKMYQTTKEAVTIIKTESAKHLGRMTGKKSVSNTDVLPQRVHESESSESITSFNFFRSTDNPDSNSLGTENEEVDDNLSGAGKVIGKIFAKVDSTVSKLSDNIDLQKVKSLLTFEDLTNRQSPLDKVKTEEEEPVTTITTASLPNSVFSAIKTRIASMFSDGESGAKESASKQSTVSGESNASEGSGKKTRR